jgi:iron complex outermembrane recepter protein
MTDHPSTFPRWDAAFGATVEGRTGDFTVNLSGSCRFVSLACLVLLGSAPAAFAQGALTGSVTRAGNGEPMAGAAVVIEELRRETRTDATGAYRFEGLAAGEYHVSVRADGYSSRRTEVTVGPGGATLNLEVDLDLHFAEVLSVSPNPRAQFESYQPTSVLSATDLTRELQETIGATLQSQPGVTMRSLGPGPARPVIRGLDGDRVLVLQDGQRMGDLGSQSGDHGVPVNPASAQRIEVVRGPATLLYGANAIGGLVNIVTDQIPTEKVTAPTGSFTFNLGSNSDPFGGAGDVHVGNGDFALHLGGGWQRSDIYRTSDGPILNSQTRSGFANVGGGWTGDRRYAGVSYGYDDTKYGVPVLEDGQISLTPKRHAFSARAGGQGLDGALSSYRATLGVRRYTHIELEGAEIGTQFKNNTVEAELMLGHRPVGRFAGSVGGWFLNRAFAAEGAEALSPPVDQRTLATFLYEEVAWPHFTVQFGGRVDRSTFEPQAGLPARDFTEFSGSVGALIRPQAANDGFVIALSLARAARNPALEELYYFGPHPGNLTFEIGNPDMRPERALGFDVSLRGRTERVRAEVTAFRNAIADFIFRNPLTQDEFEAREEELEERFGVGDEPEGAGHGDDEFPITEYSGADARLWGVEAHADVTLTAKLGAELTYDFVRAERTSDGQPLPRIPPQRFMGGLRFTQGALEVGAGVTAVARQDRVFGSETPTAGYALLRFNASYTRQTGRSVQTLTARLDNATDRLYRSHLNFLKDVVPEIGRQFRLVYSVKF